MLLRKLQNQPKLAIPVAMALVVVGLSILAIALVWPVFFPSLPHSNWNDFTRGFLFGLAIMLELGGVFIATAATRKIREQRQPR
jgi:hypothetical protein